MGFHYIIFFVFVILRFGPAVPDDVGLKMIISGFGGEDGQQQFGVVEQAIFGAFSR